MAEDLVDDGMAVDAPVGVLRHLTGPAAGLYTLLTHDAADVTPRPDATIRARPTAERAPLAARAWARIRRLDGSFSIEAVDARPLWLNGRSTSHATLVSGDLVEFGDDGPISRFEVLDEVHRGRRGVGELLQDAGAYVRVSRQPPLRRAARAIRGLARRLATETTLRFRLGVVAAVLALMLTVGWQGWELSRLRRAVEADAVRLDVVSASIVEARREAIVAEDLDALRLQLEGSLAANVSAEAHIAREASRSVVFIQGAFGFRDVESGRMLRHVLDGQGRPIALPNGRPLLALDGDGPPAERVWTGTGFIAGDRRRIVTNHHVARAWTADPAALAVATRGLEPTPLRLEAFLPGESEPASLTVVSVDEAWDLALLRSEVDLGDRPALPLAKGAVTVGTRALALGYPTGLRAILSRADPQVLEELRGRPGMDDRKAALRLAELDLIQPLLTTGVVAQATDRAVVFDAATTRGGSGGPLLSFDGEVIGVQTAVMTDFGGSNFAVPASRVRALLTAEGD